MKILSLAFVLVNVLISAKNVQAADCAADCDIAVTDAEFKVHLGFRQDVATPVWFNVTLYNSDNTDKVAKTSTGPNFDCKMYFSATDNSVYPHNDDALKDEKSFTFSDSKVCKVYNADDMKNGLDKRASRRLYGSCNMTLTASACEKVSFVCVECPLPPTGASYTKDKSTDNNRQCRFIKNRVFCGASGACLVSMGGQPRRMICKNNQYCFNVTAPKSAPKFGCTKDNQDTHCKGKSKENCRVCDPSKTKDFCNDGAVAKYSIIAMLSTLMFAAFF